VIDLKWLVLDMKEKEMNNMLLIINGEEKNVQENDSLDKIITDLEIKDKVMAAAVNMEIVKKESWKNFIPKENDKLELLQFVGGG